MLADAGGGGATWKATTAGVAAASERLDASEACDLRLAVLDRLRVGEDVLRLLVTSVAACCFCPTWLPLRLDSTPVAGVPSAPPLLGITIFSTLAVSSASAAACSVFCCSSRCRCASRSDKLACCDTADGGDVRDDSITNENGQANAEGASARDVRGCSLHGTCKRDERLDCQRSAVGRCASIEGTNQTRKGSVKRELVIPELSVPP